jgi:hypothetical protein
MTDTNERFWQRHQDRIEKGARRELQIRQKAAEFYGEGGVKLSRAEKAELYREMALDPMGVKMAGVLANRQRANKLGPDQLPLDFLEWDAAQWAKLQAGETEPQEETG